MAVKGYTNIVTDDLLFSFDAYNRKSYVSGDTTTYDLTLFSNDGSLENNVGFDINTWSFDGVDDCINIDSVLSKLLTTTQGTFMLWVRPNNVIGTSARWLQFGDTNVNTQLFFGYQSTGPFAGNYENGVFDWRIITNTTNPLINNVWCCVVLVQDAVEPVIYFNGELLTTTFNVSTNKTTWFNSTSGLDNGRIACSNANNDGNSQHFDGDISMVMVYNRALSADEVKQNYNATKWRFK